MNFPNCGFLVLLSEVISFAYNKKDKGIMPGKENYTLHTNTPTLRKRENWYVWVTEEQSWNTIIVMQYKPT